MQPLVLSYDPETREICYQRGGRYHPLDLSRCVRLTACQNGRDGRDGLQGERGRDGEQGLMGMTGLRGPPGTIGYGYVYNEVIQPVASGAAITMSSNGALSSGIAHVPGTANVTLLKAGVYSIVYTVNAATAGQWQLALNTVPVPDGIYGNGANGAQVTGTLIVIANSGDNIALYNVGGNNTLPTFMGGSLTSINASILITQVA